jgi:hypothetical protein
VLVLVALVFALLGCGAAEERRATDGGTRVAGHGLEVTLPDGWHGDVTKYGPHHAATLRAATFSLEPLTDLGRGEQETMGPEDLLIVVTDYGAVPADGSAPAATLPIRLGLEHVVSFEGFREPVATTSAVVAGATLQVWVVAAAAPTAAQLERANAVLATLRHERARWRTHVDEAGRLSARIPPGWAVAHERLTPFLGDPKELLNVGTGAFKPGGDRCAHVPERTLEALGPEDALVTVVEFEGPAGHEFPPRPAALLDAEGLEPDSRDCLGEPRDLDYRLFPFTEAGRDFYLYVAFGERVGPGRRREAAELVDSLRFERPADVSFADPDVGVSGRHPAGWDRARGLTSFTEPREVLALASYPLRGGAQAGECAPNTARADMLPGGAFVWLLEYREQLPPERFPPRPRPFRLDRGQLAEHVACFPGPGWSTAFGAAGRQFQLLVAFGGPPTDRRLREVEEALDALAFDRLPPADPSVAWPLLIGSTPDSMRAPPGWAAAPARFSPEDEQRPRTLFFAANRPLFGLPAQLEREARRLPEPLPSAAIANEFPRDGVLLWVVEEDDEQTLAQRFPPIDRDWPGREDFEPVEIATEPNPELRWLVAAGEFRGHRFSIWIARGPEASDSDVALAVESAATVAVSGCDRGVGARCEETR